MQVQNTITLTKADFHGQRRSNTGKSRNDRRWLGKRMFYAALGIKSKPQVFHLFETQEVA